MSVPTSEKSPLAHINGAAAAVQLVSLRLGGEAYGIAIDKVLEIILPSPVTPLPQGPADILGLINLRNTVVPVVDLRLRLGLAASDKTAETRIVVVKVRGRTIGLLVDAVHQVLRVDPQQFMSPPAMTGSGCEAVIGLANLASGPLILLDLERIFAAEPA